MATKEVKIKDKTFITSIPEETILKRVSEVAESISRDYADKNPLFLAVLNGSFMFAADLMRGMTVPCEISFVKLASYQGTMSTGHVKEVLGINEDLSGRHLIIVEDIEFFLETLGFEKESAYLHRCRIASAERLYHALHGGALWS